MDAPLSLATERLRLRAPTRDDAPAVYASFASDAEVTRFLSWPCHESVDNAVAFVLMSERTWSTHGVGPYLITDNAGAVLGSTGLEIETPYRASTG